MDLEEEEILYTSVWQIREDEIQQEITREEQPFKR